MSAELLELETCPSGAPQEPPVAPRALLQRFLGEQEDLTAVERFSQWHTESKDHRQRQYYETLIPQSLPVAGQQYSFEVNLEACSGCKACVTACHNLNGLDDGETWRDVGLLIGGTAELPVLQHVTTACHHCLDPGCLQGCPVEAYVKDPATGIVKHLDDQCFGCQYCTWMCPYDVPKYNPAKGIVRKCDMCSSRLQAGEAPACVQACPHQAIRIRTVNIAEVREQAETRFGIPQSPNVSHTFPSTRYVAALGADGLGQPVERAVRRVEHAHVPLIVMLLLTQIAVGGFLSATVLMLWSAPALIVKSVVIGSMLCTAAGLNASLFHLGRPQYAFRAVLGWRHSWLSREAIVFGLFGGAASALTAATIVPALAVPRGLQLAVAAGTAASGLAGVISSVMIYHVTQRPLWLFSSTAPRFVGTSLLTASVALAFVQPDAVPLLLFALASKLILELRPLFHLRDETTSPIQTSALLMVHEVRGIFGLRMGMALVAILCAAASWPMLETHIVRLPLLGIGAAALIAGEVCERWLFFTCVAAQRMPGGR